jgi:Purple acid Phosphatase, N-terminal domain/Fibronectin type III domain
VVKEKNKNSYKNWPIFLMAGFVFFLFAGTAAASTNTGTYTSQIKNLGQPNASWGNFTWATTQPSGNTQIIFKVRTSNSATMTGGDTPDFSTCAAIATVTSANANSSAALAGNSCVHSGDQYAQYQAILSSTDNTIPAVSSATINFAYYPTNQTLTSSAFNSTDATNVISGLNLRGTLGTSTTSIKMQVRSAPDNGSGAPDWTNPNASGWCGASNCTGSDYFVFDSPNSGSGQTLALGSGHPLMSGGNHQWFQYKIFLNSDGATAPLVDSVTVNYVVNAPPDLQNATAMQNTGTGTVTVNYQVRDTDTETGTVNMTLQYCNPAITGSNCSSPTQNDPGWTNASSVMGDVGTGVSVSQGDMTQWTSHTVTWTPKTDYPNQYNASQKIRLIANDGQLANNLGYSSTVAFSLDTKAPQNPQIALDRSVSSNQITIGVTEDTTSGLQYVMDYPAASIDGSSTSCFAGVSDYSTLNWQSFTYPQMHLNFSDNNDDVKKVCVLFRDAYGNLSANNDNWAITPRNPYSFQYYDVSNPTASDYRLFLSWGIPDSTAQGTPGFGQYEVQRCNDAKANADCTPSSTYSTITSSVQNYIFDIGLDQNQRYCYRYRVKDTNPDPNSDYSQWSSTLCAVPGSGATSTNKQVSIVWDANPDINVPPSKIFTTDATIHWNTVNAADPSEALLADSTVRWKVHGAASWEQSYSVSSTVSEHNIDIPGKLTPGTTYDYQVTSTTPWGTTDTQTGTTPATFTTPQGPTINNVVATSVGNATATVEWDTQNQDGSAALTNAELDYSNAVASDGTLSSPAMGSCDTGWNSHHQCTLSGLTSGTNYYYYVTSVSETDSSAIATSNNGGNYYQFMTTMDNTPPVMTPNPNNPVVKTDTQASLSWTTDERASSWILYDTASHSTYNSFDTLNFDPTKNNPYANNLSDPNSDLSHTFILTLNSLVANTTFYYRLVSEDTSGNVSVSGENSFTTLQTQIDHPKLIDPGDPTSDDILVKSNTQALISIVANTHSTANLCYSTNQISNTDFATCLNGNSSDSLHLVEDPTTNLTHSFLLGAGTADNPVLSNETKYYYRIQVVDSQDATNKFLSSDSSDINFTTLPSPDKQHPSLSTISTPTSNDITLSNSYAFVSWTTDQLANQELDCGTTNGGPYDNSTSDLTHYNQSHTLDMVNLNSDTKYYCVVKSTDNLTVPTTLTSDEFSFTTKKDPALDHDPLSKITNVSDPPSVLMDTNAVVTFDTDQAALCIITATTTENDYSTPLIYEEDGYANTPKSGWNMHHSIPLTNLIPSTKYYYKINCEDNLGTAIQSDTDYNFTTSDKLYTQTQFAAAADKTPPVISSVKTSAITGESVTVAWTTDKTSNSLVSFGAISGTYDNMAGNNTVNADSANYVTSHSVIVSGLVPATKYYFIAISTDASGNIAKSSEQSFTTAAPSSISSIQVISTALNQATITWNTSNKTTSSVEYGLSDTYGQVKTDSAMSTTHSVSLSGLQSGATYHYRVKGQDQNNNLYASADNAFIPKSPPSITGLAVTNITDNGAEIKFTTNIPTDALITYTDAKNPKDSGSQGKPDMVTAHDLTLTNMTSGENFAISLKVRDVDGNETTQAAPNFTTSKRVTPPVIDQVLTDDALTQDNQVQAIISWTTDEPATTSILYREGTSGQEKEAQVNNSYVTNHVAVSTIFKPGAVYYFKVKSVDPYGNVAISQDYALLTPKQSQNIIQIIISNFQGIFSWLNFGAK